VVVGQSFGADDINTQTAPIQARLVENLRLGMLAEPRKAKAAV
jgi:hypothetical protein